MSTSEQGQHFNLFWGPDPRRPSYHLQRRGQRRVGTALWRRQSPWCAQSPCVHPQHVSQVTGDSSADSGSLDNEGQPYVCGWWLRAFRKFISVGIRESLRQMPRKTCRPHPKPGLGRPHRTQTGLCKVAWTEVLHPHAKNIRQNAKPSFGCFFPNGANWPFHLPHHGSAFCEQCWREVNVSVTSQWSSF